jgi:diaminopimelate decarboxylase
VSGFAYANGELNAERVPLSAIAARYGTPCFVYSRAVLEGAWREFDAAFAGLPHLVCYAMKANSNLAVLNLFARLGSGFDIVSGGELARAIAAGGDVRKVVFSGVGKTEAEMEAALAAGILCFNVESAGELARLAAVAARMGRVAPVSFRVNPDVDPKTHPYISTGLKESKFGIAFADAPALYRHAARLPSIGVCGIDIHLGSQITELSPFREATGLK